MLLEAEQRRGGRPTLFDAEDVADQDRQGLSREPLALDRLRVLVLLLRLEPFSLFDALTRRPRRARARIVRHILRLLRSCDLGVARGAEPRQGRVDNLVRDVRRRAELMPALVATLADDELVTRSRSMSVKVLLGSKHSDQTHPVLGRRVPCAAHLAHEVRVQLARRSSALPSMNCEIVVLV
jgi:hypothetical protein